MNNKTLYLPVIILFQALPTACVHDTLIIKTSDNNKLIIKEYRGKQDLTISVQNVNILKTISNKKISFQEVQDTSRLNKSCIYITCTNEEGVKYYAPSMPYFCAHIDNNLLLIRQKTSKLDSIP